MRGEVRSRQSEPLPQATAVHDKVAAAVLLIHFLTVLATLVRYDGYEIAKSFLADDTFYYLHIANNIASGLGSTFDGLSRTNGYHPLWMIVCTAIASTVERHTQIEVLYATQGALVGASAWLLYRGLRRLHRGASLIVISLFLSSGAVRSILMNGMESALGMTFLCALLFRLLDGSDGRIQLQLAKERWIAGSMLLGLALSRLEMALVALTVLSCGITVRNRAQVVGSVWVVVGLATSAIFYLALNQTIADWPVPISGSVKWGQPETPEVFLKTAHFHLTSFVRLVLPFASLHKPIIEVPVAACLVLALLSRCFRDVKFRFVCLGLVTASLGFSVSAIHRSGGFSWYGWPALFAGALGLFSLAARVLDWLERRGHARFTSYGLAVAAMFVVVGAGLHRSSKPRPTTLFDWATPEILMDVTIETIRAIPINERISGSSVGLLAFMTERGIVQTEGLVNDREYLDAIRSGTTRDVLARRRVRWFVGVVHDRARRFPELFGEDDVEQRTFLAGALPSNATTSADDVMLVRLDWRAK